MEEFLRKKKLPALKDIASALGISTGSTKDSLIQKIMQFIQNPENLEICKSKLPQDCLNLLSGCPPVIPICCSEQNKPTIRCTKCDQSIHQRCSPGFNLMRQYTCPSCILPVISPLEPVIDKFIDCIQFKQNTFTGTTFEIYEAHFELTPNQKKEITQNGGNVQIQARCLRADGKTLNQVWPKKGNLIINDKTAMKFETSTNQNAKKRKDEPLNITMIVNEGKNRVSMIIMGDLDTYYLSIYLVKKKSEDELISEVRENNSISVENSKAFIMNSLATGDPEVLPSSIKFSLRCPMTGVLVEHPVRGKNCKHIRCFDLKHYLNLQKSSKVNRWLCPVCKFYVYEMVYDLYIKEIIETITDTYELPDLEIHPDASYNLAYYENDRKEIRNSLPLRREDNYIADPQRIPRKEECEIIEIDD